MAIVLKGWDYKVSNQILAKSEIPPFDFENRVLDVKEKFLEAFEIDPLDFGQRGSC